MTRHNDEYQADDQTGEVARGFHQPGDAERYDRHHEVEPHMLPVP